MIVLSFVLVIVAAVTLVIGLFQTDSGLEWIWASIGSCVAAMVFLGIGVLQRRGAGRPRAEADEAYRPAPVTGLAHGPGSTMTESEPAGVAPEGELAAVTGYSTREPSQRILEAEGILEPEPSREFTPETPVVPKRTAESGASRMGAEAAAETRTEEMPVPPARASAASVEDATASPAPSASTAESPARPATKKTAAREGPQARAGGKMKGRAARPAGGEIPGAVERTTAKETSSKATKKATSKQSAMAPAARHDATQRAPAKKATGRQANGPSGRAAPTKSSRRTAGQTTGEAARAELAKIKGLGPAKQEALLREFGSVEAIQAATVEQLTSIRGIGVTTAREILARARH